MARKPRLFAKEALIVSGRHLGGSVTAHSRMIGISAASVSRRHDNARRMLEIECDLTKARNHVVEQYERDAAETMNRNKVGLTPVRLESIEGNNRANAGENSRMFGGMLGIQEGQPWYVTNFSLISAPASQTPDPHVNPRFVTYLASEQSLANRIIEIAYFARDSVDCTNAFKALSAVPINEQIKNTTIVTESVFGNQKHDLSGWTGGDQYIGPFLRSVAAKYPNTADASVIGEFNNTGRRFIGLTNAGINESVDYLAAVIIHSFIHSGGIGGRNDVSNRLEDYIFGNDPAGSATRITPSDLHYRGDEYDAALDACIKGPKKTKAPRAKPYGIPTN